ncbi:hypothetical protein M5K25_017034 [Dendrobium thyrsiflorum]|uniref:Uncharacterized protein n=1 Tax=Dendrobium thyrsiflorum TaxID=117978 RepID=A0ABD0UT59_DENTH
MMIMIQRYSGARPLPSNAADEFRSADLRNLAEEAHGRKLLSQRASSHRCFRSKCRNFRSDGKGTSSKERSRTATREEPKKRLVQKVQIEKMKSKP